HLTGVGFGLSRVHDDGLSRVTRQGQLCGECPTLLVARRMIVVVIEAAFSDGDGPSDEQLGNRGRVRQWIERRGVVRMNPGSEPDEVRVTDGDRLRASGCLE